MEDTKIDQSGKIQSFGFASFIYTITKSCFLGLSSYIIFNISNIDSYFAAILGSIIGIVPLFIFIYTIKHSENKDILDLNTSLFGKPIGAGLNIVLTLTVFFMAMMVLYNISEFAGSQYIPETNINYVRILLLIPIVYAAGKDIKVISRISQIIFYINIAFFIVSCLGLVGQWKTSNIYPILKDGVMPPIQSALFYMVFTAFPMFLTLIIPQSIVQQDKHKTKKIVFFYFLVNVVFTIIMINIVFILGKELLPIYRYPEFTALKKFELLNLIERVENTLSLQYIFTSAIYLMLSFHFVLQAIKKIVKNETIHKLIPAITGILILIICNIIFSNSSQFRSFIQNILTYVVLIGILLPMTITFIGALIKNLIQKTKQKQKA